jgi:hypothetical protein
MPAGTEKLPRPLQLWVGVVMGSLTIVWALNALVWLAVLVLLPLLGGAGSELMVVAAVLVVAAVAGLPPMLRLTLFLQWPRGRRALTDGETRRLAIAFVATAALHAALMTAPA